MKNLKVERDVNFSFTRSSNSTNHEELKHIPLCIVEEILFKLPTKSVLRCKVVCKSWYDVITSPIFSKYYAKSSGFTWILGSRLSFSTNSLCLLQPKGQISISLDCLLTRTRGNLDKLEYLDIVGSDKLEYLDIVGSCNGLCCFIQYYGDNSLIVTISNPITGERVELPKGKFQNSLDSIFKCSFGPSNDGTFKVVRFEYDGHNLKKVIGQIFTLGVDKKWRNIEDPCFPLLVASRVPVFFNGASHWVDQEEDSFPIYGFNFEEEKGRRFTSPFGFDTYRDNINVLDDCLCAVVSHEFCEIEIWVMKQYGIAESWDKYIILRDQVLYCTTPITRLEDGRILFWSYTSGLVVYDREEREYIRTTTDDFTSLVTYVPCFSSSKMLSLEDDSSQSGKLS